MRQFIVAALFVALAAVSASAQVVVTPPSGGFSFPIVFPTGGALQTGTTTGNTLLLQAYDTDTGPAYTTLLTLTAGTAPSMSGLFGVGTAAAPAVSVGTAGHGMYWKNIGDMVIVSNGSEIMDFLSGYGGVGLKTGPSLMWNSGSTSFNGVFDVYVGREAAATLQMGADVNGTAVAQTLKAHDGITGTDIAGANLTLAGGRGTGTGTPGRVKIATADPLTTGTTAQTLSDRMIVGITKALSDGSPVDLFEVALPTISAMGVSIQYTITATDGTDVQSHTGLVNISAVNKGGVYSTDVKEPVTAEATATSAGTLTETWTATGGTNKVTIACDANTSLTPTVFRIYYTVINHTFLAITIL